MPDSRARLCQRVPAPYALASPAGLRGYTALMALLGALACDGESESESGARRLESEPQGAPPAGSAPRAPTSPPPTPLPQCPAIACFPQGFEVRLERATPWAAGTYFIRASVDGGPRRACSVVFEPVLGAAHDTCGDAELPFRVHYRYDELEQALSSVSFGQVQAVHLTVLTSEEEPPLVDVEHQLTFSYAADSGGCGTCPASPAPLSVRVSEPWQPADAGSADAGRERADASTPRDGADAGDAGS